MTAMQTMAVQTARMTSRLLFLFCMADQAAVFAVFLEVPNFSMAL